MRLAVVSSGPRLAVNGRLVAALLTLLTGYDYLKAGIRHAIDR